MTRVLKAIVLSLAITLKLGGIALASCDQHFLIGWPNQSFLGQQREHYNPDLRAAVDAVSNAGCEFTIVVKPWPRLLQELADGRIHVLPAASFTPEREEFAYYSAPYRSVPIHFAFAADRYDDLSLYDWDRHVSEGSVFGKQIGQSFGYELDQLLSVTEFGDRLVATPDLEMSLNMLALNRLDVVIGTEFRLKKTLALQKLESEIRIMPEPIGYDKSHLLFSKTALSREAYQPIETGLEKAMTPKSASIR